MKWLKTKKLFKRMISIILLILVINIPSNAFARAGGGGSGGGGGGGGGGGSSSHHSGTSGRYNGRSNPISSIISLGMFFCISSAGVIIFKVRLSKKKIKSISTIKNLGKNDYNWDYDKMKDDIEKAFYKIQDAWMERNQDIAKEFMSEKLYVRHRSKTEWMKVRKEKNILKNMKLIKATPIAIKDKEGVLEDIVWVHIKAKSIDYLINEATGDLIEGNKYRRVPFEEYWKFIRYENRWVLDEIRQIDEISDLDFFDINIDR